MTIVVWSTCYHLIYRVVNRPILATLDRFTIFMYCSASILSLYMLYVLFSTHSYMVLFFLYYCCEWHGSYEQAACNAFCAELSKQAP